MALDPQFVAMLKDIASGQVRHYLGIAGTALASYGVLGCQGCVSQTQFIDTFAGVIIASIGPLWSWWEKTGQPQAQARLVQMIADAEMKKTAAAQQWAAAEAAKKALASAVANVPPATAPQSPQPPA